MGAARRSPAFVIEQRQEPRRRLWLGASSVFLLLFVFGALTAGGCVPDPAPPQTQAATPTNPPSLLFAQATPTNPPDATPIPIGTPPPPPPTPLLQVTLPPERTVPYFCQPPQPTPTPGAAPTNTPGPTATPTLTPSPTPLNCTQCPWKFTQQTPAPNEVHDALVKAADRYHLPHDLVFAIAQGESSWNPYWVSCYYDIGLMQMKYGLWEGTDLLDVPECGLAPDAYDPYILQDNAYLGAKLLAWLTCYYSYWGGVYSATPQNPGRGTIAWYYQQAGLNYPDTKNADETTNANSLCAAVYHDGTKPYYTALTATQEQFWSCPYTAKAGDSTLLDVVISTYNQGIGTTNAQGITNQWYVNAIEGIIISDGKQYGAG